MRNIAVLIALLLGSAAWAKSVPEGQFTATSSDEDAIQQAIEAALDEMAPITRGFARGKLQKATTPCRTYSFRSDSGAISVQCDGKPAVVAPPDGKPHDYAEDPGGSHHVEHRVEGNRLIQRFHHKRGTRTNTFVFDGNQLRMQVVIESSHLPEPVVYERVFRAV